jgi:multidrug efflux pump subunit AcrA (membrane-fusion protein)
MNPILFGNRSAGQIPTVYTGVLTIAFVALSFTTDVPAATDGTIEVQDCVVRFASEVSVPALESGRVDQVLVAINEPIREGMVIARLDEQTLAIRRRAALLRLNAARHEAGDDVELQYAKTALSEAQAELDMNRSIQNDVRGAIPMTQMRRLRLAVERGELEIAQAEKRREQAEMEAQLREADLAMIEWQRSQLQIDTPLDGVVLEVTRAAGEWIERGQPIATVARIDRLRVQALVDSRRLAPSRCRGLDVTVHWNDPKNDRPRSLRGNIRSVDPQMLPGSRFRLHAEVVNQPDENDPSQWQLKPGVPVRMKIHLDGPASGSSLRPPTSVPPRGGEISDADDPRTGGVRR